MKKRWISLLCILLCVLALIACGKKEEEEIIENDTAVVGTWTESIWDSGYTFREDGSGLDIFWDEPFTYVAVEGDLTITYTAEIYQDKKFTYTVDESTLTLTKSGEDGGTWSYTKQ